MSRAIVAAILAAASLMSPIGLAQEATHAVQHEPSDVDAPPKGHWMAPAAMAKRPNPIKPTAHSIERGRQLFQTLCANCHGDSGQGDGPGGENLDPRPANLATMAPHHRDGDLAWKIAQGRGAMPGWEQTLKPEDIWSVVNYLRVLAKR
jgi:mono/diheme cytochrome c family protein